MPRDKTISRIKTPGARLRAGLPQQPEDFLRTFEAGASASAV